MDKEDLLLELDFAIYEHLKDYTYGIETVTKIENDAIDSFIERSK